MVRWDAALALPEPAQSKFRRLAGVAQDRQAATTHAYGVVEDAREVAGKVRLALQIAERSPLPSTEAIERAQADIDRAEAEVRRLAAERDERAGKSTAIVSLVSRLDSYVGDLPRSARIEPFDGTLPPRKASEPASAVITRCRGEVDKLKIRISEILTAPRPAAEVMEQALREIEALAERGVPDFSALFDGSGGIDWPTTAADLMVRSGTDGMPAPAHGSNVDVLGLLAWLFKPQLVKAITAAVEDAEIGGEPIPSAQRPKLAAQFRASLLEVERIEEAAAEELEAMGVTVERRVDADPRAVLGLSSALPPPHKDF
jgi:hypothetical protein